LGIIYDADELVRDALKGQETSGPNSCNGSGVFEAVDNFAENAAMVHRR
jgi:hypothetical protein